jgi:hypothetical protein
MTIIYDTVFPPQPEAVAKPEVRDLPSGLNPDTVAPILPCKRCEGLGHTLHRGFRCEDGYVSQSRWNKCGDCNGNGWFHAPDLSNIVKLIKGRKPGKLRSKRPDDPRGYYVWRLARFHGGADMCLPMMAEMNIGGDPYRDILEELSKIVAKNCFGSENYGSARWHLAMYGIHNYSDISQHFDGPVYDSDKPIEEILETV